MAQAIDRLTTIGQYDETRLAHLDMITSLLATRPARIVGNADATDLADRADHLREVFRAVACYVDAIVTDAADRSTVAIDRKEIAGFLSNTASDIVGALDTAGETLRLAA